ncbi:MAG: hypothetical protein LDL13_02700 [Calditerrivibrio sp.]|nr:hypothetical protein [Calditerrivibrio sp.]MCA1932472.1 hypothetical protein [Calditerrivibrio sp.]MCA1981021.1 hypothetical protein [Calditerrivibrio sp.]
MKKLLNVIILLSIFSIILAGCSSIYDNQQFSVDKKGRIYVGKFKNNTETFLAGERAASITKTVLSIYGYDIINISENQSDDDKYEIEKIKSNAKNLNADILVTGEINEWRYKTGIDGEPAVGLSLVFIDLKSNKIIFSAVGAKSGWGHESITTLAQKLIRNLINK